MAPQIVAEGRDNIIRINPTGPRTSFGQSTEPAYRFAESAFCVAAAKRRYATLEAAEEEIERLKDIPGEHPVRAYACDCGALHLTRRETWQEAS